MTWLQFSGKQYNNKPSLLQKELSKITAAPLESGWEVRSRGGRTPLGKGQMELSASVGPPPAYGRAKRWKGFLPCREAERAGSLADPVEQIKSSSMVISSFLWPLAVRGNKSHDRCVIRWAFSDSLTSGYKNA